MLTGGIVGGENAVHQGSGADSAADSDPAGSHSSGAVSGGEYGAHRGAQGRVNLAPGAPGEAAQEWWAVPGVDRPGQAAGGEPAVARMTSAEAVAAHPVISRWAHELREMTSTPADLDSAGLHELFLALTGFTDLAQAHTAPVATAWKDRRDWEADGSKSANHALARDTHQSTTACAAVFRRARRLQSGMMPETKKAWEVGEISAETVDLLIRAASGKRTALFAEEEAALVGRIAGMLHVDVVKEIRYWVDWANAVVDPDGTGPGRARHLHVSATFGGAVAVDGVLDPVGGAILMKALRDIDAEFTLADKRAAEHAAKTAGRTARAGGGTAEDGVRVRTSSERLADALVELAVRATQAPKDSRRPTIALHVAVGSDKLAHLCETFGGVVVTPADLAPYLDDSTVQVIRFSSDGQPEAATRTASFRRFYTGAMRTAIQVRDRRCQHPAGCDEPAETCDLDHIHPVSAQGATDISNGRLLCVAHNRHEHLRHPTPLLL